MQAAGGGTKLTLRVERVQVDVGDDAARGSGVGCGCVVAVREHHHFALRAACCGPSLPRPHTQLAPLLAITKHTQVYQRFGIKMKVEAFLLAQIPG